MAVHFIMNSFLLVILPTKNICNYLRFFAFICVINNYNIPC